MSATITLSSHIKSAIGFIEKNFDPEKNQTYFFFGNPIPWEDENSPDIATSSDENILKSKYGRIFCKRIPKEDVITGIKRFNWKYRTVYTRADFNVDHIDVRNWIHPESPFYVMNSEENVYKCISNNYGAESTEEPMGQSTGYIETSDGYIWKFMFGLKQSIKDKFLTDNFIPVPYLASDKDASQLSVEAAAIPGEIAYVHVVNGGQDYTTPPIIQIRGDGQHADVIAVMSAESIDHIAIANRGSGYTITDIKIFGTGTGAELVPMIAPPNGHGSNALYELGASFIIVTSKIISSEGGIAPITGTYRTVGITQNLRKKNNDVVDDDIFNTLSTININGTSGKFDTNEIVIGEQSKAQGRIYFDDGVGMDRNIQMYEILGDFQDGERLHGQDTGHVGTFNLGNSTPSAIDIKSGNILYTENILFITRRNIQTEEFIFTIEF